MSKNDWCLFTPFAKFVFFLRRFFLFSEDIAICDLHEAEFLTELTKLHDFINRLESLLVTDLNGIVKLTSFFIDAGRIVLDEFVITIEMSNNLTKSNCVSDVDSNGDRVKTPSFFLCDFHKALMFNYFWYQSSFSSSV